MATKMQDLYRSMAKQFVEQSLGEANERKTEGHGDWQRTEGF